jgi:hypothetical protein
MHRVLGVIAVALCVSLATAYGGSSLQAIAHKQATYYGDARAAITRIETVRIRGARPGHARWVMIQMKGRHAFRVGCPRPGPGPAGPCRAHYLEVGIDLANHQPGLTWGLTASQVSAITKARHADRSLRIFPDTTGLYLRCVIPHGGPTGGPALIGTCSTVAPPTAHVRYVKFTETWGRSQSAGWYVTFSRNGRIKSIRVTGRPPQTVG